MVAIKQHELDVLLAVNQYDCLTIGQLQRILLLEDYIELSRKCKRMTEKGLLERKKLPPQQYVGNATYLHKVGAEGKKVLLDGQEISGSSMPRFAMGDDPHYVTVHYWHTVATNDFFITINEWAEFTEGITLLDEQHELAIRRNPAFPAEVLLRDGTKGGVVPDGWCKIKVGDETHGFILEYETGTQRPAVVRRKIDGLIAFAQGPCQRIFKTKSLTYLLITTTKAYDHAVAAILQVWKEYGFTGPAQLFRVTDYDPKEESIVTKRVWTIPGDDSGPKRLLED